MNKYIIFSCGSGFEFPIIFPAHRNHSDFADGLKLSCAGFKPIRAGLFGIIGDEVVCGGESMNLGLSSDKYKDGKLLTSLVFANKID